MNLRLLLAPAPLLALALLSLGAPSFAAPKSPSPYASSRPLPTPVRIALAGINTGQDDAHVAFSPDGRELYFVRTTPDFAYWTLFTSRFEHGRWTQPVIAPFSGRWSDADPAFSPDGQRLFFISTRPVGSAPAREDPDLWVMDRSPGSKGGWGPPRHLDAVSSPGAEWFPSLTRSGTLYFGSERAGGLGKSDLWRAEWRGDRFGPPENLGSVINTADQEIEPYIAPDESYLIFSGKRPGGPGAYDLFVSYRCEGKWTSPQRLGAGVNSAGWDFGARVSPDGRFLFFTSNRSDYAAAPPRPRTTAELMKALRSPGNGLHDVYQVDVAVLGLISPCAAPSPAGR
jgi:dipeptidyl aminopeptidase/acylaminoacyl peptidase